jgi:ABC-2 type transport system permease protein
VIRLVATEANRLLSRRLVRVFCLLATLAILLAGFIVFFRSSATIPEKRFDLGELPGILMGTGVPLILIAWVFGASFAGAEWQKGTMTTALTWEPRRLRLFVAKIAATVLSVIAIFVVLQALLGLALTPAGIWRGSSEGIDGAWLVEVIGALLRGAAVAAVGAAIAFAIAMAGRNTGAALGFGFAYGAIAEEFLRAWKPHWAPWLFKDNAARFISAQDVGFPPVDRTTAEAGLLLAVYAVIFAIVSALLFRRGDVT